MRDRSGFGLLVFVFFIAWLGSYVAGCGRDANVPAPAPITTATATSPVAPAPRAIGDAGHADVGASVLVVTDASSPAGRVLFHRGVNLSGGEFGACCPGRLGYDYGYPTHADVDLMAARGVVHLRVGFRHERIQPALQGPINEAEWARLWDVVTYARSRGMLSVAIEPHNSARFNGTVVTETQFGDFWGRVAQRLPADGSVWPDLTNEPHDMKSETWLALAKAAVREIRRVGFKGRILVPGNGWDGAASWAQSWYGTPNATLMQQIDDPLAVFEAHLYLDSDASGKGTECVSETIGTERLQPFLGWLRAQNRLGYLGEFAAPNTSRCAIAVKALVAAVEAEPTHFIGWAWWSAGSRWPASYMLSLQPVGLDAGAAGYVVADRPQLEWLRPFLGCSAAGAGAAAR